MRIAVIGGGVAGLTCAIRLAEKAQNIELFEAAPHLGGRTRSFFNARANEWVDNGPHLLIGAYNATRRLLQDCDADRQVHWQGSLQLPFWHPERGTFKLAPAASLPLAVSLPIACWRLPGHGLDSLTGLIRLSMANHRRMERELTVRAWLDSIHISSRLQQDLLEPLCLGAMNESSATASAASFARVLRDSFACHDAARLGWFRAPLSEALVRPLQEKAEALGAVIHKGCRIRKLRSISGGIETEGRKPERFDRVVLALPAGAGNTLLGWRTQIETRPIMNLHLWFDEPVTLPEPLTGGLGTQTNWFFDVSQQHGIPADGKSGLRHICAVTSADIVSIPASQRVQTVCHELAGMLGLERPPVPRLHQLVCERRATNLVRPQLHRIRMPEHVIDACEHPEPGSLPATIELAVRRGEMAAEQAI